MLQGAAEPVPTGKAAHVFRWNCISGAFLKSAWHTRSIRLCHCHFQTLHLTLRKWLSSGETGVETVMVRLLLDVLVGTVELAQQGATRPCPPVTSVPWALPAPWPTHPPPRCGCADRRCQGLNVLAPFYFLQTPDRRWGRAGRWTFSHKCQMSQHARRCAHEPGRGRCGRSELQAPLRPPSLVWPVGVLCVGRGEQVTQPQPLRGHPRQP